MSSSFNQYAHLPLIVVFIERLSDIGGVSLPASHIHHLNTTYKFNTSPNVEIRLRWYNLALASPGASSYSQDAAEWLVDPKALKGRMKFCRPVFRGIFKIDPELARKTWKAHSQFFHPIARRLIEKVRWLFFHPFNLCVFRGLVVMIWYSFLIGSWYRCPTLMIVMSRLHEIKWLIFCNCLGRTLSMLDVQSRTDLDHRFMRSVPGD